RLGAGEQLRPAVTLRLRRVGPGRQGHGEREERQGGRAVHCSNISPGGGWLVCGRFSSLAVEGLRASPGKAEGASARQEGEQVDGARIPGLKEQPAWPERDLEQAIMDRLQEFLLELGKGFCFVARRRITFEGEGVFAKVTLRPRFAIVTKRAA